MTETMLPATTQGTDDKRSIALLKAVGLDKLQPEQRELALNIAARYDLDLLLKHLVIIEGRAYITRDGLIHVAHRSGVFDGIEVEPAVKVDGYWRSMCSVYRKDMSRPFTYPGRYPASGGNAKYNEEMAVKVAEVAALRRAFDVSAPTVEERWDDAEAEVPAEAPKARSLAELARERRESLEPTEPAAQADPAPVTEAVVYDATPEPRATVVACGEVAQDGLMTGAVCVLKPDHAGAHKSDGGSWPA